MGFRSFVKSLFAGCFRGAGGKAAAGDEDDVGGIKLFNPSKTASPEWAEFHARREVMARRAVYGNAGEWTLWELPKDRHVGASKCGAQAGDSWELRRTARLYRAPLPGEVCEKAPIFVERLPFPL
ncbi:hypothetical protein P8C59_006968 [Phyllachora maydis]|uniref:Uncharacterized protein n=1 Tax=Phyllachora maydis TaxID=1825666 RepID=A0AAD9I9A8_9PEZI|nr:hypothetical protein P8C59_006968 [Phyllachora maydis]